MKYIQKGLHYVSDTRLAYVSFGTKFCCKDLKTEKKPEERNNNSAPWNLGYMMIAARHGILHRMMLVLFLPI
jgi:hypothetical protein